MTTSYYRHSRAGGNPDFGRTRRSAPTGRTSFTRKREPGLRSGPFLDPCLRGGDGWRFGPGEKGPSVS